MDSAEYDSWCSENCTGQETQYFNGIEYKFCTMQDGWIAIFEYDNGSDLPKIQARDEAHAASWCSLREPVPVPLKPIA